jgi:hypothetical protein
MQGDCPNLIAWWGVSNDFPFVTLILSHFVASIRVSCTSSHGSGLPGHPCDKLYCRMLISLSAHTNDPQYRQMKKEKFGGLQKLYAGYIDGRLSIDSDIMKRYIDDFSFNNNDYVD